MSAPRGSTPQCISMIRVTLSAPSSDRSRNTLFPLKHAVQPPLCAQHPFAESTSQALSSQATYDQLRLSSCYNCILHRFPTSYPVTQPHFRFPYHTTVHLFLVAEFYAYRPPLDLFFHSSLGRFAYSVLYKVSSTVELHTSHFSVQPAQFAACACHSFDTNHQATPNGYIHRQEHSLDSTSSRGQVEQTL